MKKAIIIGATGLVGGKLLELLSKDDKYGLVFSISRNLPDNLPSDAMHIPFNNGDYEIPSGCDEAYCCLGTTMKKAGSKEAFLKVDLDMVVAFADKAKKSGIKKLALVSSIGANPEASNFYLKTKGQVEEKLKAMGFSRLVVVRPSLLLGKRNEARIAEDIGKVIFSILGFLMVGPLKKYRGIQAHDVAKAMVALLEKDSGVEVVESDKLKLISGE